MLNRFSQHVHQNNLFTSKQRLLLALSGGVDSVVLAHLLKQGDFNFAIAHCNFQLRGRDSHSDERFCKALAESLHVPFYTIQFDLKPYAVKHKLSTQMAARNLRYEWFQDMLKTKGFDFLLTAHHANDSIETMLLNLVRGSGIKGMKGIPEKNGRIIRPLLCFNKDEILKFAKAEKFSYRKDKSNNEAKYDRNFIRLKVIPLLKKLNPSLEKTMLANMQRFAEEGRLLNEYLDLKKRELIHRSGEIISIDRAALLDSTSKHSLLHALLNPYGFNETQESDVLQNLEKKGLVGKNLFSKTHQLTIDRAFLLIRPLTSEESTHVEIHDLGELLPKAGIHVQRVKKYTKVPANELFINLNKIVYPMVIRSPKRGDKFKPFGMKGFKLLSDYLKSEKMNAFEKESILILQNGNGEIIWVIGHRSDERYKIVGGETNLLKLVSEKRN
jgi:tRNA(Ile)-lysidine synthase